MIRTLFLMFVSVLAVSGQVKIETYSPKVPLCNGKMSTIKRPYFSADNKLIAIRLNHLIYESHVPKSLGEVSTELKAYVADFFDYNETYKVFRNDSHIVSLACRTGSSSGSLYNTDEVYLNCDPSTGRSISIYDLLTADGTQKLSKRMIPYWKRVDDSIAGIYENVSNSEPYGFYNPKYPYISDYYAVSDSLIVFHKNRWFNYRMQGTSTIAYSFNAMEPYLNDFGRKILFDEQNSAKQPNNLDGQIYYGAIGNSKITLKLHFANNNLGGYYYYDKYQKQIGFSSEKSKLSGNSITLTTSSPTVETISAKITPTGLVGTWKSKGKTLPFKVSLE